MRRFTDGEGRRWDVVLGRESWGALYALFVPLEQGREAPVLQAILHARGYEEAQRELDGLDEEGLARLLGAARPKEI